MAPPKKTARPAQENISLGPQAREGKHAILLARQTRWQPNGNSY